MLSAAKVLREVEVGVLAIKLIRLAVAGLGGLDLAVEKPQVVILPSASKPHQPFVLVAMHPHEPGRSAARPSVRLVLLVRAHTQIASPVVQAVAVDMVDNTALAGPQDDAVHVPDSAPEDAGRIDGGAVTLRIPLVLAEPLVILGIDGGEQPASQRDTSDAGVGLIGRRSGVALRPFESGRLPGFRFEVPAGVNGQDLPQLTSTGRMVRAQQQPGLAVPLVHRLPRLRQGTGVRAQLALAREQNPIDRPPPLAPVLLGPDRILPRRHAGNLPPCRPNSGLLTPVCCPVSHDSLLLFSHGNDGRDR
jgi:hypothetical protein